MSSDSDLFQRLVGLPNVPKGELPQRLGELIAELKALDLRIKGGKANYFEEGHRKYLAQLAARGRHHLFKAARYRKKASTHSVVPFDGRNGHSLRDYYHDCYYAAFYAVRFGLVRLDSFDCTMHAELPKALEAFKKRTDSGRAEASERAKVLLEGLSRDRNTADYVLNRSKLSGLANGQMIQAAFQNATKLFEDWGVP